MTISTTPVIAGDVLQRDAGGAVSSSSLVRGVITDYSIFFFFFSSRRRHTRCSRDWSSDVCSSDLGNSRPVARPDDSLYRQAISGLEPGSIIGRPVAGMLPFHPFTGNGFYPPVGDRKSVV